MINGSLQMRGRKWMVVAAVMMAAGSVQAAGDAAAGKQKSAACVACHGTDGNAAVGMYANIAGQHASYLEAQLKALRDGGRTDPVMSPMAANLSDEDIADLAAYFSSQQVKHGSVPEDAVEPGARIYRAGNAKTGVPACMACHGPQGLGNGPAGWPALGGQHPEYVAKQLKRYASGERRTDINGIMRDIAARMSESEIDAVSKYVYGLH
ncbi:MAG: c-type cytochrome [Immundisolibacter sp.]